jgi:hypothetical protein
MRNQNQIRRGGALKKVLIAIAILLVVVVVGGVLLLDTIARTAIAAAGTHVLGTKTTVAEASIGIVSGKTAIRGLEVDNPKGYAQDVKFVMLGEIAVDAGLSSFTGDKIVIEYDGRDEETLEESIAVTRQMRPFALSRLGSRKLFW